MANPQIEIQFTGTYQLDQTTVCVNPFVIAQSAVDNFIDKVTVNCSFSGTEYQYGRNIGSFNYVTTWINQDVIDYINSYMAGIKVLPVMLVHGKGGGVNSPLSFFYNLLKISTLEKICKFFCNFFQKYLHCIHVRTYLCITLINQT